MATFSIAFKRTMGIECAYDNNPDDIGGETCWGIARNYHPRWKGWGRVDALKVSCMRDDGSVDEEALSKLLANDPMIAKATKSFYREEFWDRVKGDSVPNQFVANELFDTAVNMSPKNAIKFLQECLNKFNRDERDDYYNDMEVDGHIGPVTVSALKIFLMRDDERLLLSSLNTLQGAYYMENSGEPFIRGYYNKRLVIEG